ncbi:MAG: alpha/beta hydrolase family protein [Mucilaginibacter sp.]
MKKLIILCVYSIFAIVRLNAQDMSGSWLGSVAMGSVSLSMSFNISKIEGVYTATFDCPDQKVFGISCRKTVTMKDSIYIEIAAGASFKGSWDGRDAISGFFKQGPKNLPLNLKRISAAEKAALAVDKVRPQTPKPPFGYVSEEVEYDNADKSLHYGATFTRPAGGGNYPAVIIVSGSGTQDRDGTLFGHKLYWVLADYLTKNGIAVLRVDDRGAGKSTLGPDFKNATSLDFSHDVESSLNYLETRTDINKERIGLVGHSEGGIIAPMVAARRKDVDFIVLWGAPEIGGARINTEQNVYQIKKQGLDSTAVVAFTTLHKQILSLVVTSTSQEVFDAQVAVVFDAWRKAQSEHTLETLHAKDVAVKDVIAQYNGLYSTPWMRYFITYDPAKDLAQVKCPVLAVNGEKDTQVDAKSNLNLIKEILTKNGNKDFEIKALPGLNHLLQTAPTGDVFEYALVDETMSPVAMDIISSWIKMHAK